MNELRMVLARNLITIRNAKGLSQKAAAEQCGITDRAWRYLETCYYAATVDTLEKLANGLEVSPSVLLSQPNDQHRKKS